MITGPFRSSVKPRKAGGILSKIFIRAQTRLGYSRRSPRSGFCRRLRVSGLPAILSDHSWITDPRLVHHATGANESLGSKRWDGDARTHKETISCSGTVTELEQQYGTVELLHTDEHCLADECLQPSMRGLVS